MELDPIRLHATLRAVVPSAYGLSLCPAGGERFGGLYLCSARTVDLGPTEPERITALYKVMVCLVDELPYEEWPSEVADARAAELVRWREAQVAMKKRADFLAWLGDRCGEVLNAQRELSSPLNPPRHVGAAEVAIPEDLRTVISDETFVACLDDRWNDATGVFRSSETTFLVSWWTSA